MNPEVKAPWIANLRSGNYPQGRSALNREGSHCCIGVLAETMIELGMPLKRVVNGDMTGYQDDGSPYPATGMLRPGTLRLCGLTLPQAWGLANSNDTGSSPDAETVDVVDAFVGNHDELGQLSFSEIADWIEENL